MPWWLEQPGHLQAWYWPNKLEYSVSSVRTSEEFILIALFQSNMCQYHILSLTLSYVAFRVHGWWVVLSMLINPLHAKFFTVRKLENVSVIDIIPPHWHDTGSWNPSSWKTRTYLFHIVDIMGADVLVTQGARAFATKQPCFWLCWIVIIRSLHVER